MSPILQHFWKVCGPFDPQGDGVFDFHPRSPLRRVDVCMSQASTSVAEHENLLQGASLESTWNRRKHRTRLENNTNGSSFGGSAEYTWPLFLSFLSLAFRCSRTTGVPFPQASSSPSVEIKIKVSRVHLDPGHGTNHCLFMPLSRKKALKRPSFLPSSRRFGVATGRKAAEPPKKRRLEASKRHREASKRRLSPEKHSSKIHRLALTDNSMSYVQRIVMHFFRFPELGQSSHVTQHFARLHASKNPRTWSSLLRRPHRSSRFQYTMIGCISLLKLVNAALHVYLA